MSLRQTVEPIRSLGVGALAEAILVRLADGTLAVCKRMHRHCAGDLSLVAMLEHEARLLARFNNRSIPKLIEFDTSDGVPAMFIEHLDGGVLAIDRTRELSLSARLVAKLLGVLGYVHSACDEQGDRLNVVHRDIAPGNVLVRSDGSVALVDFTIATSAWRHDPDKGVMKGTRGYMAPEVITGEREADHRADLYSAGVLLWELTVGERLFVGTPLEVMTMVVECPVRRPGDHREDYPPELEAVVLRALARDPDERFSSAGELAAAIETALNQGGERRT